MHITEANQRCAVLGLYLVEHNMTVRGVAKEFGISKSTVHKDVTVTLKKVNRALYMQVKKVLDKNKMERHLRGGEATKKKYAILQKTTQSIIHKNTKSVKG